MPFYENIFQDEKCSVEKGKMIAAAQQERCDKQPQLALIRLRVTYSGPWQMCLYGRVRRLPKILLGQRRSENGIAARAAPTIKKNTTNRIVFLRSACRRIF